MPHDDNRAEVLQDSAATLRAELALSMQALQLALRPSHLANSARQGIIAQITAMVDPPVARALSTHGTAMIALTAAAFSWRVGHRAFAKSAKQEGAAQAPRPDPITGLMALTKEVSELLAMAAVLLEPRHTKSEE